MNNYDSSLKEEPRNFIAYKAEWKKRFRIVPGSVCSKLESLVFYHHTREKNWTASIFLT